MLFDAFFGADNLLVNSECEINVECLVVELWKPLSAHKTNAVRCAILNRVCDFYKENSNENAKTIVYEAGEILIRRWTFRVKNSPDEWCITIYSIHKAFAIRSNTIFGYLRCRWVRMNLSLHNMQHMREFSVLTVNIFLIAIFSYCRRNEPFLWDTKARKKKVLCL